MIYSPHILPTAGVEERDLNVNKNDLVEAVASQVGDRRTAAAAVEAVLGTVMKAVRDGEPVALSGFGVFEQVDRAARSARNPSTGETVAVPAKSAPRFRPGQVFKDIVSGERELPPLSAPVARTAPPVARTAPPVVAGEPGVQEVAETTPVGEEPTTTKATEEGAATPSKKPEAKKAAAKKAEAKKPDVKKADVKKAAAKKADAKKADAKKADAKKAEAKKAEAKKAASSKDRKKAGKKAGKK